MDAVRKDVLKLVKKEFASANTRFPMFSSAHEGWAVIREEMDEMECERYMLDQWVENRLWNNVKNNTVISGEDFRTMYYAAVNTAVESIQVAAMILKMNMSQKTWLEKKTES